MKESISYAFLLNIIITFIFVCFAIIMGIISYYKAFRANTIIAQAIEKYEGYNCASKEEINIKLQNISYNTPFNVTCNGKDTPCVVDENSNYAIISYNLDKVDGEIYYAGRDKDKMSSTVGYQYDETTNVEISNPIKNYQYGIYTYMYINLPIVSGIIKIPFFAKTDIMYEFRDLEYRSGDQLLYDSRMLPENVNNISGMLSFSTTILSEYANASSGKRHSFLDIDSDGYIARKRAKIDVNDDGLIDSIDTGDIQGHKYIAGIGMNCKKNKTFENY